MKKIVVLSDTHGNKSAIRKIENIIYEADLVIHLGDGVFDMLPYSASLGDKLISVDGNCDGNALGVSEKIIEAENRRILATHGHLYAVKRGTDAIKEYAKKIGCDIILYGHTHKAEIREEDGLLIVNPGTLSRTALRPSFCYLVVNGKNAVAAINEKVF